MEGMMVLFAQAGEIADVAKRASDRLLELGAVGVLVLVIIGASIALIRYFISNNKEDRVQCATQHAALIASFEKRSEAQRLSHEKEMMSLCDMMEKCRKTNEDGDKAMRDVFQLWMNRMADKVLEGGDGDGGDSQPSRAKRKAGGAS
jgi:hypothetical protein